MNDKEKQEINNITSMMIQTDFAQIEKKLNNHKGVILNMEKKVKNKLKFNLGFSFASLILMALVIGLFTNSKDIKYATIGIDVNPSIELDINKNNKVLSVRSINDDAKKVLENMDLKGTDLVVATNAIVGSMYKLGYISNDNNSILISVIGGNYNVDKVVNDTVNYLKDNNVDASIITQKVNKNNQLKQEQQKYNISAGKANLIDKLLESNPVYSYEQLSKLNTNELNILINSEKNKVKEINVTGSASKNNYITEEKLKQIVFEHAKVNQSNVKNTFIEFDYDDHIMVYEFDFICDNIKYEYEVNAKTGAIIEVERETLNKGQTSNKLDSKPQTTEQPQKPQNVNANYISKQEAKQIALNKAGITNPTHFELEFDYENGVYVYEIEFKSSNNEYDVEIDAITGKIIKYEVEKDND